MRGARWWAGARRGRMAALPPRTAMKPHAFIAMPFGTRPGPDGRTPLQFDRVLQDLLRPALEQAGFEVFRADEETRAGDIRADMFQELLVADLVLAELSVANPNVWYELGVRHALRARGVVLVYGVLPGVEPPKAFDVYTDRKLRYALTADGVPDPAGLADAVAALATLASETLSASTRRRVSPVYQLLPHLEQPQWKKLLLAGHNEFRDAYDRWADRMAVARQTNAPGDLLTLADETPTRALALEARCMAGNSLLQLRQPGLALEQFDAALQIDPDDLPSRQKRAVCLGRLERFAQARSAVQALARLSDQDADSLALAGRLEKDAWTARWRPRSAAGAALEPAVWQAAAAGEDGLLAEAVRPYRQAFELNPGHYYSGINALTLSLLRAFLGGSVDAADTERLRGGVRWAVACALLRSPRDYWARASQAELSTLCDDTPVVQADWRAAVAAADGDWFALDSSRQTLVLLQQLAFRPAQTQAALDIVEREIGRVSPPFTPRQVLLFSGHMMDTPDRATPRFPPALEPAVARALDQALDTLDAGPADLALCQASAGGDLMFLEACVARGLACQVLLPFDEPQFLQHSVLPSAHGEAWRARWLALKPRLGRVPRVLPDALGPGPADANPFERCNRWLLNTALASGPDRLRFVCLWDGQGADGPGGTRHLWQEASRRTGEVRWIDSRSL